MSGDVKRETGEIPVRARHCDRRVRANMSLGLRINGCRSEGEPGKAARAMTLQPGNLPDNGYRRNSAGSRGIGRTGKAAEAARVKVPFSVKDGAFFEPRKFI